MATIVTLSSKGQLVIPSPIREALGLEPGHSFAVSLDPATSRITLSPVPTLDELSARVTGYAARSGAVPVTDVDEFYQAHRDSRQ